MPRILLLITDLEIGGTPTVVRELAIRLSAAGGAYVEVACLSRRGPVADQLADAGIAVTCFNAGGVRSFPHVWRQLTRLIRRRQFDTVFSFLIHANAMAAAAAPFCRGVRFLQSIQTTQPTPRWHWRLQALVQHAAEKIVVPSESVAQVAWEWADVPRDKLAVISNAICIPSTTGFQLVQKNNPPALRIGFIGRLDPIKRIPDLIEAIPHLEASISLHIYGEGSERLRLQAMIEQMNLTSRVTLHGVIAQPADALSKIDVLVLPSQAEGFGLVLIEAMAAGVPVVATDVPGIRDVVKNEETGLLVPVASPKSLASAIRRLLNDDALRERMIDNAIADVRARFSWEKILPQYQALLNICQNA